MLKRTCLTVISLFVLVPGLASAGLDVQNVLKKAHVAGGLVVVVGLENVAVLADGSESSRQTLESPPVWDGLAATQGRLYVAAVDGSIVCFGN